MNCIVIDDEPFARLGMQDLIETDKELRLFKTFKSTIGVTEYLATHDIDLVFLDIEMPGTNGLEFASAIPEQTLVIFTTAYSQYALESYEVDAIDYIVKPIHQERFNKAVNKARAYKNLLINNKANFKIAEKDYIIIRAERRNFKIKYNDITYIEALKDYVIIYTETDRYITWMNLKTIHSKLPQSLFVRVSKSYVANHEKVTSFDNNTIFINKTEINLGKTYRQDFHKKMSNK